VSGNPGNPNVNVSNLILSSRLSESIKLFFYWALWHHPHRELNPVCKTSSSNFPDTQNTFPFAMPQILSTTTSSAVRRPRRICLKRRVIYAWHSFFAAHRLIGMVKYKIDFNIRKF
jgi:hypothetical protein